MSGSVSGSLRVQPHVADVALNARAIKEQWIYRKMIRPQRGSNRAPFRNPGFFLTPLMPGDENSKRREGTFGLLRGFILPFKDFQPFIQVLCRFPRLPADFDS